MTIWIIEPHDPLLARDGRPFDPTPGARARSLPFPFPSTTAGAIRTRAGEEGGRFPAELPERAGEVKAVTIRGPLLAALNDGVVQEYFAPAPTDALLIDKNADKLDLLLMEPLTLPPGGQTDLAEVAVDGAPPQPPLLLVGPPRPEFRKAARRPPAYWKWGQFERWLTGPADATNLDAADLGIAGPPRDRRSHVGISADSLTGLEGALFMTAGLSFWHNAEMESPRLSGARQLGLVVDVDNLGHLTIDPGYGPMGGERRLMHWRAGGTGAALPEAPAGLRARIIADRRCRVVLLTPAYFERGWWPGYLTEPRAGVSATLVAAAVGKAQTVSGFGLAEGEKGPRPSRRLAPAGSVFYLQLSDTGDAGAWFDETWMKAMSDTPADRDAGFGLAAVGVYAGPRPLNIEEEPHA